MATNVFVRVPKIGDAVIGHKTTKKIGFISLDTFDLASLNTEVYEIEGVVYKTYGKWVKVCAAEQAEVSAKWMTRCVWNVTGATLDGESHEATITYRTVDDSWAANKTVTFTYSATTLEEVAEQFNTFVLTIENFVTQDWGAEVKDGKLLFDCIYAAWQQFNYTAISGGLTAKNTSWYVMPEIGYNENTLKRNGYYGTLAFVGCYNRYIDHYSGDINDANYNPASVVAKDYGCPVCLPAYLGTSALRGQDNCAALRELYGEGEEGWHNYIKSCLPVYPTDRGSHGMCKDNIAYTKLLASFRDRKGEPMNPAAYHCATYGTICLPAGSWGLPSAQDCSELNEVLLYGTTGASRSSDPVNAMLKKMGRRPVPAWSSRWSSERRSAHYALYFNGNGSAGSINGCSSSRALPSSLFEIEL